nr:MAG TPA: hypothetical protein [Caudoviricetes sp.]
MSHLVFFFQLYIINIEDKSKLTLCKSSLSKFINCTRRYEL